MSIFSTIFILQRLEFMVTMALKPVFIPSFHCFIFIFIEFLLSFMNASARLILKSALAVKFNQVSSLFQLNEYFLI